MSVNRRGFLKGTALAGAGLMAAGAAGQAQGQERKAVLNLSSQEGRIPGDSLEQKLQRMAEWGFDGIEFGGGGLADRVESIKKALAGTDLKASAICAGYSGVPISENEATRREFVESSKPLLDAAGAISSTGMIVVPAFNGQTKLGNQEARPILIDILREVGANAEKAGTRVLLEPLNRGEAFFLRQLADAAAICRDVDHPAVCMMGDFYHMHIEETSDMGAFISAGKYLHHVHLATRSPNRALPGQDNDDYRDGFRGLKMIGYQDYCSLECGCKGDPMVEVPKSAEYLRRQWEEA